MLFGDIELGFDGDLACPIDEPLLSIYDNRCQAARKRIGVVILRLDYVFSLLVYEAELIADLCPRQPLGKPAFVVEAWRYHCLAGLVDKAPPLALLDAGKA